jgi:hypothetical protein
MRLISMALGRPDNNSSAASCGGGGHCGRPEGIAAAAMMGSDVVAGARFETIGRAKTRSAPTEAKTTVPIVEADHQLRRGPGAVIACAPQQPSDLDF